MSPPETVIYMSYHSLFSTSKCDASHLFSYYRPSDYFMVQTFCNQFIIYCPSYTTQWRKVKIMQQLIKLHVSTPWGQLQAYKIWYHTYWHNGMENPQFRFFLISCEECLFCSCPFSFKSAVNVARAPVRRGD